MSRSPWNLIASGSDRDVTIRVCESLQFGDRYQIALRVGGDELELVTREMDFLGTWLGMLSLELGRGIDQSSAVEGVLGDHLRLVRDLGSGGFQMEYASTTFSKVIGLRPPQLESLRVVLDRVLRHLSSM